mmetsp:Transcript_17983/g.37294  ORF Transcript_17983/g.37294 Transcript_17983/m.37294 type:complete len:925 (-) Transcript_17983:135-2909(-)
MHVLKPAWLRHDSGSGREKKAPAVCAVDFQPSHDGSVPRRLATGGEDCSVRIWSVAEVDRRAAAVAADANASSALDVHDKAPKGALLAVLREHTQMVNSVRWSPNGKMLASGGADMVLLIHFLPDSKAFRHGPSGEPMEDWQCRRPLRGHNGDITDIAWSPESDRIVSASVDNSLIVWDANSEQRLAKLDDHRGFVKGVAWDPMGRYIASQSDDRSVVIWRCSDWRPEKRLRRILNALAPSNSMVFFTRLTWSVCGTKLLATNAYMKPSSQVAPMFSRESGFSEEKDDLIEFVGHTGPVCASRYSPRLYRKDNNLSELPYQCLCLGGHDRRLSIWVAGSTKPLLLIEDVFDEAITDLSWSSDGYRLIASSEDGSVVYLRFLDNELGGGKAVPMEEQRRVLAERWRSFVGSSAVNGGTDIPESADILPSVDLKSTSKPISSDCVRPTSSIALPPKAPSRKESESDRSQPARASQREERLAGGKRRIIPQTIQSSNLESPKPFRTSEAPLTPQGNTESAGASVLKRKRTIPVETGPTLQNMESMSVVPSLPLTYYLLDQRVTRSAVIRGGENTRIVEAVPFQGGLWTVRCLEGKGTRWRVIVGGGGVTALGGSSESILAVGTSDSFLHCYSSDSGRLLLPAIALDSPVWTFHFQQSLMLVVTISGQCSLYDTFRFRLLVSRSAAPLLAQPAMNSKSETGSPKDNGGDEATLGMRAATIRRNIVAVDITSKQEPLLMLSDGHSFVYDGELCAWLRVADDLFSSSEMFTTQQLKRYQGRADGIIGKLQASAAVASHNFRASPLANVDSRRATMETLTHLENLIVSSKAIGAYQDAEYYLILYVTKLASQAPDDDWGGTLLRLREVCDALLQSSDGITSPSLDLGFLGENRLNFLETSVLPILKSNVKLQRFCKDYEDMVSERRRRLGI